jgi:hypothetical protein
MAARGTASSIGWTTRRVSETRAFSFASFSFHVKENEETISKKHPSLDPITDIDLVEDVDDMGL